MVKLLGILIQVFFFINLLNKKIMEENFNKKRNYEIIEITHGLFTHKFLTS